MARRLRFVSVLTSLMFLAAACQWPWQADPPAEDAPPESLPFVEEEAVGDDDQVEDTTTTTEPEPTTTAGSVDVGDPRVSEEPELQPVTPPDEPDDDEPPATTTTTTTRRTPQTVNIPSSVDPDPTTTDTTAPSSTTASSTTTTEPTTTTEATTTTAETTTTEATTTTVETTTTTAAPTTTTTTAAPGPVLVWSDEFDSFDSSRWKAEHSTYGDGGRTLQCYTPQQATVAGGALILTAEKRTETCPNSSPYGSTRDYTSGMVRSTGVTFSPGQRITYRVKLTANDDANQGGLWPALWTSGWAGGGWPAGGEWDGFEVMTAVDPTRTVFGLHFANDVGNHAKSSEAVFSDQNFTAAWHVMEFDYGRDGVMIWRMDGRVVAEQSGLNTLQGWPAPFDQAMRELKINLALGGNPGPLDDRALPATYQIDYVRIYDLP